MMPLASMDPYTQQMFCPDCGAPAPFRGAAVSLVCEYCGSTVVRVGVDIQLVGKVSAIVDSGSPIILGARGQHNRVPFEIVGRLQVSYARGTWNEWFLQFADGQVGWLADCIGQYSLMRPRDVALTAGKVPPFEHHQIGATLVVDGLEVVVVEKRAAAYRGAEGMLPFAAQPGFEFHSVDFRGYRGEFVTLDYGTDGNHHQPVPYVGVAIELEEVGLHPLRAFEGWPRPSPPGAPRA